MSQSLQSEYSLVYQAKSVKGARPWQLPNKKLKGTENGTVFSQRFLSVTFDEVHNVRNLGPKHYSCLRVFQQGIVKLALTATPLLTGPKVSAALS
jgi:hypothetical protein